MADDLLMQQAMLNKVSKDKFLLIFDLPKALRQWNSKYIINNNLVNRDSIQFSIFGAIVPEIAIPSVTLPYAAQSLKVSSHARSPYEDIEVGFTVDNRFRNWWTIWKWLDLLNDAKESGYDQNNLGNVKDNYMRNYQTDFTILAMDEYDTAVMKFTYSKAFPVMLNGINYDYKTPEEVVSGFTFSFSQFLPEPIISIPG